MRFQEFFNIFLGDDDTSPEISGAPFYDLTIGGVYPEDVYECLHKHLFGDDNQNSLVSLLYKVKGNQKHRMTVYWAIPKDDDSRIQPGDTVTPNQSCAKDYGRSELNDDFKIITKTVNSRDLYSDGNSLMRWEYRPTTYNQKYHDQLRHEKYNKIIDKIKEGRKIPKINLNKDDKWFGKEAEYLAYLYKKMPFLAKNEI
jgi:hypothetical protein